MREGRGVRSHAIQLRTGRWIPIPRDPFAAFFFISSSLCHCPPKPSYSAVESLTFLFSTNIFFFIPSPFYFSTSPSSFSLSPISPFSLFLSRLHHASVVAGCFVLASSIGDCAAGNMFYLCCESLSPGSLYQVLFRLIIKEEYCWLCLRCIAELQSESCGDANNKQRGTKKNLKKVYDRSGYQRHKRETPRGRTNFA